MKLTRVIMMIDVSYISIELMGALKKLEKNAAIYASALIAYDGLPLIVDLRHVNEINVAAISASMLALGEQTMEEFGHGTLQYVLIKGDKGVTIVCGVNDKIMLVTLAPKDPKLGMIFLEIKNTIEQIKMLLKRCEEG